MDLRLCMILEKPCVRTLCAVSRSPVVRFVSMSAGSVTGYSCISFGWYLTHLYLSDGDGSSAAAPAISVDLYEQQKRRRNDDAGRGRK